MGSKKAIRLTTPGAGKRAELEAAVITITVDETSYTFRPSEVSAVDSAMVRREVGMSLQSIMGAALKDPDIDVIAAIVWLARRQAGEDVSFEDVASGLTYDSDYEQSDEPAPEDPDLPQP